MKIIRPVKFSDVTLNVDSNSWTLWQSCNVVNPGKIFHSNSIGSPSIVSKVLYSDELLNQVNVSSQTMFDCGFSLVFPRHNTESENTWTFVCKRLMTCSSPTKDKLFSLHRSHLIVRLSISRSSPIKDKYFHEEFSQLIVFTPFLI